MRTNRILQSQIKSLKIANLSISWTVDGMKHFRLDDLPQSSILQSTDSFSRSRRSIRNKHRVMKWFQNFERINFNIFLLLLCFFYHFLCRFVFTAFYCCLSQLIDKNLPNRIKKTIGFLFQKFQISTLWMLFYFVFFILKFFSRRNEAFSRKLSPQNWAKNQDKGPFLC